MGLEIGRKGLSVHQQALNTTGHNISNADNKEYSRQRVIMTSADPIYNPSLNRANSAGAIGQGTVVASIERIRDSFIDDRIIDETNAKGYWKTRDEFIYQVEKVYNEPSDQSIRSNMDKLWVAWEELSKYPEERATREVVKERAVSLSNEIQNVFRQLDKLRTNSNSQIEHKVNQINLYASNLRDLNVRIVKSEAVGDSPNDLLDKRDALIEKLSSLIDVSVSRSDEDEIMVYIGSENLVQGEVFRPLAVKFDPENNGLYKIEWKETGTSVKVKGGELGGLLSVRDGVLKENINDLNSFAINLTDLTNEVHNDGFGRRGDTNNAFFENLSLSDNVEGNYDLNNDGQKDVTAIFKVSGRNKISDTTAAIGINGVLTFNTNDENESTVQVSYREKDTIKTVMKKINDRKSGVVAYLNHNNQLSLKSTVAKDSDNKNFMIRHLEDSGQLLVGVAGILKQSGAQGAFDYKRVNDIVKFASDREKITLTPRFNPAARMAVDKGLLADIDKIAAAKGKDLGGTGDFNKTNGIGDGSNALAMAKLRHGVTMVDTNTTFSDFYTSIISRIGSQGEESRDRLSNQESILKNLGNLRESVSGINLDEEMSNMVAFQHGYNAAARVISTMDKMLETIINRMGV